MAWRHISVAIFRRFIQDEKVQKTVSLEEQEAKGDKEADDEAFDLQAGHGSRVAWLIYGRLITESPFPTGARRAAFRRVSREWHRFLLFHSVLGPVTKEGGPGRTIVGHWRPEAVEEELRRWRRMKTVNLDRLLV